MEHTMTKPTERRSILSKHKNLKKLNYSDNIGKVINEEDIYNIEIKKEASLIESKDRSKNSEEIIYHDKGI